MRNAILLAIVGILIPIIVARPHVGIYAWAWLSYMNPHRLTYGAVYSLNFAMVIALVTIFAYVISREPKRYPLTTVTITLFLLHAWLVVTTIFALNQEEAIVSLVEASKILFMTYLTVPLINSRQRLEVLTWVIALSIGFFGIKGGIWTMLTGGDNILSGPSATMIADNNALALALAMVIPLFGYLALQAKAVWIKLATIAGSVLCLVSIAGTYARGVYLAVAVMVFFQWLRSKHRLATGTVAAVAVACIFVVMPSKFYDEIYSINEFEQDASSVSRLVMWKFGWTVAVDRPLVGGGFDVFPFEPVYKQFGLRFCTYGDLSVEHLDCVTKTLNAHSNYFEILGEHGFVGLGLYLLVILSTFLLGYRIIRRSRQHEDLGWAANMARMLQLSIVGYAVGGLFYNRAFFDLFYHIVVMMVITNLLLEQATERVPSVGHVRPLPPKPAPAPGVPPRTAPVVRHRP